MGIEWVKHGKPSLVGIVTGMVAGLTRSPPAPFPRARRCAGFGVVAGIVCYWCVGLIKQKINIDDSSMFSPSTALAVHWVFC